MLLSINYWGLKIDVRLASPLQLLTLGVAERCLKCGRSIKSFEADYFTIIFFMLNDGIKINATLFALFTV